MWALTPLHNRDNESEIEKYAGLDFDIPNGTMMMSASSKAPVNGTPSATAKFGDVLAGLRLALNGYLVCYFHRYQLLPQERNPSWLTVTMFECT